MGARARRAVPQRPPRSEVAHAVITALFLIPFGARPEEQVVPGSAPTMVMDGLDLPLSAQLLLAEPPPHVLSFDYLCRPVGSPAPDMRHQPDLHTPVTTAADAPSFFGPLDAVEPPPISGVCCRQCVQSADVSAIDQRACYLRPFTLSTTTVCNY